MLVETFLRKQLGLKAHTVTKVEETEKYMIVPQCAKTAGVARSIDAEIAVEPALPPASSRMSQVRRAGRGFSLKSISHRSFGYSDCVPGYNCAMQVFPVEFFQGREFRIDPKLCFVLMPFREKWSNRTYTIIKETVEGLNYVCRRADEYYGRVILHDIWAGLNEAALVIADLSNANPNVNYDLESRIR